MTDKETQVDAPDDGSLDDGGPERDGPGGSTAPAPDGVSGSSQVTGASDLDGGDTDGSPDRDAVSAPESAASRGGRILFAVLRAVAVLVAAFIGYQAIIPSTHVIRARMSRLALARPGIPAFAGAQPQSGEQDDSQTGLAAVSTAAKRSPNQTGLYTIAWSTSQTAGAGLSAYLLPNDTQALTALSQVRAQQLSAGSYSSNSFARRATASVPGVAGSAQSVYTSTSRGTGSGTTLVVTAVRYGRVVVIGDVLTSSGAQNDAGVLMRAEYTNLGRVEPGFSLTETYRPPLATALWAAGAVVLAAIFAFAPAGRRWRARRRKQKYEEEMAHRVVVRGQVIYKHRL